MATDQTTVSNNNDEIDLGELLGVLIDHKWLIAAITGVFMVLSVAYAVLATPIYQANAMVQVEQKIPSLPGLSDLKDLAGDSAPQAVTEIALLNSRMVVGTAVNNQHLQIVTAPHRFPLLGNFIARRYSPASPGAVASPWLGMNSYDWGGAKITVDQLVLPDALYDKTLTLVAGERGSYTLYDADHNALLAGQVGQVASGHGASIRVSALQANPGMTFDVTRLYRLEAIGNLQKLLSASEQGKDSGIIAVTYQSPDPARATAVLNEVVNLYVKQNVDRSAAEAASSLDFVQKQLPSIRADVDRTQTALSDYQTKVQTADITQQTKGLLDQVVAVETSLSQLKLQQAEVERLYTPDHPAYQALMRQIGDLQSKKAALQGQVSGLPQTQQQLLGLMRDAKVATDTYSAMLAQQQQLSIARAGTVGNARLVDAAAVDVTQPVAPKKAVIAMGGTFLGGFLAVALVMVRNMLRRGVEDPAVIEALGLPVYASVPMSEHQTEIESKPERRRHRQPVEVERRIVNNRLRLRLLAVDDPADLAIEAMRSLRTSLHFAMLEAKNNILMISGASPNAGKTFVSTNLAAVIAQAGQRVLLLDGDLRRGTLHRVMGSTPDPGLSELLAGTATLEQAIHKTSLEQLQFIGRGHAPPNPSELLMHANFTALLEKLSASYDLVIVDTPPILAVTDAAIIGRHVGASLLVARFGMNQPRELTLAKQRFEQNRVEIKGAIFNAVQKRAAGYYAYGYYEYRSA